MWQEQEVRLIRDSLGSWIKGFAVSSTGLCTSVKAELWAVVTGLELAWPVVLRRLILEMDSDNFFPLVELEAEHRKK